MLKLSLACLCLSRHLFLSLIAQSRSKNIFFFLLPITSHQNGSFMRTEFIIFTAIFFQQELNIKLPNKYILSSCPYCHCYLCHVPSQAYLLSSPSSLIHPSNPNVSQNIFPKHSNHTAPLISQFLQDRFKHPITQSLQMFLVHISRPRM